MIALFLGNPGKIKNVFRKFCLFLYLLIESLFDITFFFLNQFLFALVQMVASLALFFLPLFYNNFLSMWISTPLEPWHRFHCCLCLSTQLTPGRILVASLSSEFFSFLKKAFPTHVWENLFFRLWDHSCLINYLLILGFNSSPPYNFLVLVPCSFPLATF